MFNFAFSNFFSMSAFPPFSLPQTEFIYSLGFIWPSKKVSFLILIPISFLQVVNRLVIEMSGQPKIVLHTKNKQIKISVQKSYYRARLTSYIEVSKEKI